MLSCVLDTSCRKRLVVQVTEPVEQVILAIFCLLNQLFSWQSRAWLTTMDGSFHTNISLIIILDADV